MDNNGIVCDDLTFRYSQTSKYEIISHASLSIEKGRVTVISGSSGCGKSTLLYLMAGIYPQNAGVVDCGSVLVEGKEIGELEPSERMPLV
ncbi:MAG: ATP-binding cassette domain-containing protein, partial [Christensenella sp.]|uniref:ATP-binding cassette domain-containing protein n=1 Tax=Christensenella sp. TaxID=1935934 RepID=UPI002B1EA22E